MSILAYNGGAMVAMKGENCVSIAADRRFGIQAQTVATNFEKIFEMGPHLYVGLPGLATDTQTVMEKLRFRKNFAMLSHMLYEKRFGPFFVEPVVAGLEPKTYEPFICNMDLIGCINQPKDFVVGGTASAQLYGMCEALWEPNLGPDDLFETTSQALINAFDRDAISGWGATIYIIEKDKVTIKNLKTRMD
ncbi:hypothetical protein GWI33_012982 [Rhynchophorus ferrugineus]|uniref:Proteasome subunit beta n=1 Tax=Rhynchophorus ferrugineus TaxID=354439 RepID=A0A834MDN5_RHYFE|nr:hypothetical protein GWI33_012982 [Rhynchophorus ferrugineus]